ncbi:MAG: protein kinase [Archangiaceae bacterium]|nr:protein kinase [Archangiaceae bacterium]
MLLRGDAHVSNTGESKVPTQTFLLPGQEHCIGLPWERAELPRHGLAPAAPPPAPQVNPFDQAELAADPCAGLEIGACQVVRRLSSNSANSMLAVRADAREGTALVVLRKLELPEAGMPELLEHAQRVSRFRHANLSRVYGCEASEEGIFWVSEFVSGATLAEINATCRKVGKGVPAGLALAIAHETALALDELHTPGAHPHGFVSDETVFVTFEGYGKLLDLGLIRCIAGKILRPAGLGALAPYLSPEQVGQGRVPDPKTDVYALAAVLHECLSGQKLPNGFERQPHFAPPSSFNVALGRELDAVMARALDADRSKRFASAGELARALKAATSAFMWKAPQRAEFVTQLFQTRKRREQVLQAGCEEILWKPKRPPTEPRLAAVELPVAAALPPAPPTTSMRAPPVLKPLVKPAAVKGAKPGPPRSSDRPVLLALIAVGLFFVWDRHLVDPLLVPQAPLAERAGARLGPLEAVRPASVAPRELGKEVAELSLDRARTLYAPGARPKAAARKKASDAPLPPWLQPRRRH